MLSNIITDATVAIGSNSTSFRTLLSHPREIESTSTSSSTTTEAPISTISRPGRKRAHSPEDPSQADKRRRNNAAAAKYRQKKVDRIAELEQALSEVCNERDDLKIQLAKRDAEVEILRRLVAEKR